MAHARLSRTNRPVDQTAILITSRDRLCFPVTRLGVSTGPEQTIRHEPTTGDTRPGGGRQAGRSVAAWDRGRDPRDGPPRLPQTGPAAPTHAPGSRWVGRGGRTREATASSHRQPRPNRDLPKLLCPTPVPPPGDQAAAPNAQPGIETTARWEDEQGACWFPRICGLLTVRADRAPHSFPNLRQKERGRGGRQTDRDRQERERGWKRETDCFSLLFLFLTTASASRVSDHSLWLPSDGNPVSK